MLIVTIALCSAFGGVWIVAGELNQVRDATLPMLLAYQRRLAEAREKLRARANEPEMPIAKPAV